MGESLSLARHGCVAGMSRGEPASQGWSGEGRGILLEEEEAGPEGAKAQDGVELGWEQKRQLVRTG
jgi:hypothetical protein